MDHHVASPFVGPEDRPSREQSCQHRGEFLAAPESPASAQPVDWASFGRERDLDAESDRFRDLSPTEQRVAAAWRDGEDLVDRQGRPRVILGNGERSKIARISNRVAQKRKQPVSDVITATEFLRMYKAVATANMQGLVLNTFLTVSWEIGNVSHSGYINSLHERYFASMRTWASDKAKAGYLSTVPFGAIWVKEVGHRLGLHSHFLIHVPQELFVNFRYWSAKAARRLLELPPPDPRQPPSKLRLTHCSWLGDDVNQQWNVFKYLMKALDADVSVLIDPDHRRFLLKEWADIKPSPQGRITGRRTGSSHSLGPAVRKRLEAVKGATGIWREKHQLDGLPYNDCFLHHGDLRQSLLAVEL